MDQYLHADRSDLLSEAIPESLKNMILVMDNTDMFNTIPELYDMTVSRIGAFLPQLLAEVMPGPPRRFFFVILLFISSNFFVLGILHKF